MVLTRVLDALLKQCLTDVLLAAVTGDGGDWSLDGCATDRASLEYRDESLVDWVFWDGRWNCLDRLQEVLMVDKQRAWSLPQT